MTILIKNGLVYDGLGNAPVRSDVLIQNKRIIRLGVFPKKYADETIDAAGMAVTPGLIDFNFNAEGPRGIIADPDQKHLIKMGVTTALGGSGGISLAPIFGGSADFIREWGVAPRFNLHWRSLQDLLKTMEKRGVGVNFGTLIGYSSIRRFFTGEGERDLAIGETESVKKFVNKSLHEGAFGLSADFSSPHALRIPIREISEVVREVAKSKRIFVASLRRSDGKFLEAIEEVLGIGRATGVNLEIKGLQPVRGFGDVFGKILETIDRESARSHLNFDVFPYPLAFFPIRSFLPDWLSIGSIGETLRVLDEKSVRDRILKHLEKTKLEELKIAEVPSHLKFLEGKLLEEFAKNRDTTKARAFLKLMMLTGLKASVISHRVDKKTLEEFLADQHSLVSLDFPSVVGEPAGAGDFLAWAESGGKIPVEKALAKVTGLAAAKFGLEKRGSIREGHWADLALWENWKPKTVIINGSIAMCDGTLAGRSAGMVLKAG